MPSKDSGERRRRRTGVSRKKQLSKRTPAPNSGSPTSRFLRNLSREKIRFLASFCARLSTSGQPPCESQDKPKTPRTPLGPIQKLHRQIIAEEIAPLRETLATILGLLSDEISRRVLANANTPDSTLLLLIEKLTEELKATKEELRLLRAFATAQYLLSGQSFATIWAVLNFLQHYLVVPTLQTRPGTR